MEQNPSANLFQEQTVQLSNGELINFVELNPQGVTHIIFVHGNFSAWVWWKDVLELIKENKRYRLFAIDQRGFGKSSYQHPAIRFTQHAEDLADFIHLKGLNNVILVGWSYGGGICMKTAQIAPSLVSKIIPTASVSHQGLPFMNEKGEKLYTREDIATLPRIAFAQNVRKTRNFEAQKSIFQAVLFHKMPNYPQDKKRELIECSFTQAEYLDVLVALANADIHIEKIKAKTLMLNGQQDIVIKLDSVRETSRQLGDVLEVWQNHGHMLPIQNPIRFVERITRFIDQS